MKKLIALSIVTVALFGCSQSEERTMPYQPSYGDEGPFETTDGSGPIGYITSRSGSVVVFKPCYGGAVAVNQNQLRPSNATCLTEMNMRYAK